MKFTVDVDCTPEEARRFIGLPDLTPLHEVYLDRMKAMMTSGGVNAETLQAMMQTWGPMGDAGMAMWRTMLERIGGRQDS